VLPELLLIVPGGLRPLYLLASLRFSQVARYLPSTRVDAFGICLRYAPAASNQNNLQFFISYFFNSLLTVVVAGGGDYS